MRYDFPPLLLTVSLHISSAPQQMVTQKRVLNKSETSATQPGRGSILPTALNVGVYCEDYENVLSCPASSGRKFQSVSPFPFLSIRRMSAKRAFWGLHWGALCVPPNDRTAGRMMYAIYILLACEAHPLSVGHIKINISPKLPSGYTDCVT